MEKVITVSIKSEEKSSLNDTVCDEIKDKSLQSDTVYDKKKNKSKKIKQREPCDFRRILKILVVIIPAIFAAGIVALTILSIPMLKKSLLLIKNVEIAEITDKAGNIGTLISIDAIIAILGIAVSVWVGLNIYNIITKDDFEKLQTKIEELSLKSNDIGESTIAASNKLVETMKSLLVSCINQTVAYYASTGYISKHMESYLAKDVGDAKENVENSAFFSQLTLVENYFVDASEANRNRENVKRVELAIKGIEQCETLEKGKMVNESTFLRGYIKIRKGDFYYYRGVRENVTALSSAIKSYKEALKIWFDIEEPDLGDKDSIKCYAYLHNIIGECYNLIYTVKFNNITQKKEDSGICEEDAKSAKGNLKKEILLKAEEHMEKATNILDEMEDNISEYFAIYYRNLGTVKEKMGHHDNARKLYERAIKINSMDALSYRNIASLLLKGESKKIDALKKRSQINALNCQECIDNLQKCLEYIQLYCACQPYNSEGYGYYAWAYSLLACVADTKKEQNEYWSEAEKYIEIEKICSKTGKSRNEESVYDREKRFCLKK